MMRWCATECWLNWAVALAALTLASCSEAPSNEPEVSTYCDVVECSPQCAALTFSACDIAEASCQAVVQQAVECVRGVSFEEKPQVILDFVGLDAGASTVDAGNEPSTRDGGPDSGLRGESRAVSLVVSREELPAPWEVVDYHRTKSLQVVGLLSPELDLATAWSETDEGVLGTYSPMAEVLNVVVFPERDAWREMSTLAHEMVHALQDQEYGWRNGADLQESGTSVQAYRAFIEGEAELYELLAMHLMLRLPFSEERLEELARKSRKSVLRAIQESDSPGIIALRSLVYPAGLDLALEAWKRDGIEGTTRLATGFPKDLAAFMRLDEQSTAVRFSCEDTAPLSDATPLDDSNLTPVFVAQHQPALLLSLLLANRRPGEQPELAQAWHATAAWRGDCIEVFGETFTPAAPQFSPTRTDAGTPAGIVSDAGAPAALPNRDAAADAGGFALPPAHLADVFVRWTMEFEDEATAVWVKSTLEDTLWTADAWLVQEDKRVVLHVGSEGDRGPNALVDCWPLYPFDPNDVYLMGDGISHWQHPEIALGSTSFVSFASVRSDGELLLADRTLFTPDWCLLPGDEAPLLDVARPGKDLALPTPCDERSGTPNAKLGPEGARLHHCRNSDTWVDERGRTVVSGELGTLEAVGYDGTLLLSTGVFHRGGLPPEPPSVEQPSLGLIDASVNDAGQTSDSGSILIDTMDPRIDVEEGTLLPFHDLPVLLSRYFMAVPDVRVGTTRVLPDGYWVALEGEESHTYVLWFIDFIGHAEQVVDYGAWPRIGRGLADHLKLDAWGRLFVVNGNTLSNYLTILELDGSVSQTRLPDSRRLVSGP